jgi:serine acetyltransferase
MKFKKSTLLIPILSVVLSAHAISPSPTVYSGAILTMGGNSTIYGNLQVAAAATLGATSTVGGDLIAGGALTLGTGGNVVGRSYFWCCNSRWYSFNN